MHVSAHACMHARMHPLRMLCLSPHTSLPQRAASIRACGGSAQRCRIARAPRAHAPARAMARAHARRRARPVAAPHPPRRPPSDRTRRPSHPSVACILAAARHPCAVPPPPGAPRQRARTALLRSSHGPSPMSTLVRTLRSTPSAHDLCDLCNTWPRGRRSSEGTSEGEGKGGRAEGRMRRARAGATVAGAKAGKQGGGEQVLGEEGLGEARGRERSLADPDQPDQRIRMSMGGFGRGF